MLLTCEQFCKDKGISPSKRLLLSISFLRDDNPIEFGIFPWRLLLAKSIIDNDFNFSKLIESSPENGCPRVKIIEVYSFFEWRMELYHEDDFLRNLIPLNLATNHQCGKV